MRIFITGGTGFIGSAVVKRLVNHGHSVRCLMRTTSRSQRLQGVPFEAVRGDICDLDSLVAGMSGCEGAIHLASPSGWDELKSADLEKVIVGGTKNVLEAMRLTKTDRLVFVSSAAAINGSSKPCVHDEASDYTLTGPAFSYAHAKHAAEIHCRRSAQEGLDVIIVNPAEVYGPHDTDLITAGNLIDFLKSSPVFACKGGTSIVHIDDVAQGIHAALSFGRRGERYILGGDNVTIRQLAAMALELAQIKRRIFMIPNSLIRTLASVGPSFRVPLPFNPAVIPYATRYWYMDSGKAIRTFGMIFRPAREVLSPTISWLLETGRLIK